jgi:hypothetical protein
MIRIVSSALAAAGLVLLAVAPANASDLSTQSVGQCSGGYACAWADASNSGAFLQFNSCSSGGYTKSLSSIGGSAFSAKNNRSSGSLYLRANGSTVAVLGPGGSVSNTYFTSVTCYS